MTATEPAGSPPAPGLVTRLGRSVAGGLGAKPDWARADGAAQRRRHSHQDNKDWLRDVILGGQDGLVNVLGIILGVIAGGGDRTVLLSAGFAAAITESISMGAVGYTSTVEDRDYYAAQRAVEEAAVVDDPELECQEISELYRAKGFSGQLLDQVVATITANRDKWVESILHEERNLRPVGGQDILRSSVVITVATFIGHLIPLFPFLFLDRHVSIVLAIVLSAVVLFGVGAYSAITRVGIWWKTGLKLIAIGLGAAALGFGIGQLFSAGGSV
ncbi:MAG TPA: VIT1/CCC1 transporter family protein [Acidimicrobiales bacterium]|nr:VIT1/CCC1 transporter family protein [Acidimicrobiales bacterium]